VLKTAESRLRAQSVTNPVSRLWREGDLPVAPTVSIALSLSPGRGGLDVIE
jgi:hypothetical protein